MSRASRRSTAVGVAAARYAAGVAEAAVRDKACRVAFRRVLDANKKLASVRRIAGTYYPGGAGAALARGERKKLSDLRRKLTRTEAAFAERCVVGPDMPSF